MRGGRITTELLARDGEAITIGTSEEARIIVEGARGMLQSRFAHITYHTFDDYFEKFNRYTTAAAQTLAVRDRKVGAATVVLRFPLVFLQQYFVRAQVLNGYRGFLWALFAATYTVVKYAKARELQRRFPMRFRDWEEALSRAARLSQAYAEEE